MTRLFTTTILPLLILFSCQTADNEKVVGTWTLKKKIKCGLEIKNEGDDKIQLEFLVNGEMKHLVNGGRAGIGFYSYKINKDSIYRTNIQIDSLGKRDSIFIRSNKFSLRHDTLTIEADEGTLYYKKDSR